MIHLSFIFCTELERQKSIRFKKNDGDCIASKEGVLCAVANTG
jgi:hypothetical protein